MIHFLRCPTGGAEMAGIAMQRVGDGCGYMVGGLACGSYTMAVGTGIGHHTDVIVTGWKP